MVKLFKGTCEAVRAMHDYRAPLATNAHPHPGRANQSSSVPAVNVTADNGHSDDEDDEMFPHPEGDSEGGYSYHGPAHSSAVPLVTKRRPQDEGETVYDGDEELARMQQDGRAEGSAEGGQTEVVPYAHRDLKPGCVLSLCSAIVCRFSHGWRRWFV